MKRNVLISLALVGALLVGGCGALAAEAGSAEDPLISLDWLKKTLLPRMESQLEEHMEDTYVQRAQAQAQGEELLLKRNDLLSLESGSTVTLFSGQAAFGSAGAVVDLSEGEELTGKGSEASPLHRYLIGEKTTGELAVVTDTAVVRVTGPYRLTASEALDYNALARALRELGLFRGTDTPYGAGFDLELTPTRIQGLIMFLRLLGEEGEALAYSTGAVTFADVPAWALPYVAYAYDKGYTKGQGVDAQQRVYFGPDGTLTARDYMTFLLRALGHKEGTDFQWLTALDNAKTLGLLTDGERALAEAPEFHRAQVAYLSYFTLFAKPAGGDGLLLDRLVTKGTVEREKANEVTASVTVQRL